MAEYNGPKRQKNTSSSLYVQSTVIMVCEIPGVNVSVTIGPPCRYVARRGPTGSKGQLSWIMSVLKVVKKSLSLIFVSKLS